MRFKEKVVVVTGSSRGIGRGIALEFGREGASVVVNFVSNADAANVSSDRNSGRCLKIH